jgi:serine/threonine protein kinase
MTPRWEDIERLYHEALELPECDRKSFLDRVCAPGDGLRAEVESLLEVDAGADGFLEAPPARLAADLLDRHPGGLSPGQRIRHYEIESLISMGGMGEVYFARDTRSATPVVLKILRRHLTANAQAVDRFETEAHAASALRHPNIVSVYEFGESPAGLFIAMEWLDGLTWRELLKSGAAHVADVVDWGAQAARALNAAHSAGILHRDIKPENIILRNDGIVKILDFGLARLTGPVRPEPVSTGTSGTISGTLSGTLLYMSPEILRGESATSASDVFSLGAVLYELAAGVHPFAGETPLDVYEAIECRAVAPLPETIPAATVILRMLDRDPAQRPTAAEVSKSLERT